MKIALFDSNQFKFTKDMIDTWLSQGHEVDYQVHYNPETVLWADATWFDTCDNNIVSATTNSTFEYRLENMNLSGKRIIVRPIDIEVWANIYRNVRWDYVTDIVFPCPHIKRKMLENVTIHSNHHDIPYGVDTKKFTFRDKPNTKKIAWVTRRWSAKGIDLALQIALKLKKYPEYKIYALGVEDVEPWRHEYYKQFILHNKLDNIIFEESTQDMNLWLEDKDYVLCCSTKETFSYAIAEGMSKGLKPIIHNFYGASEVWPQDYIWNSIDEVIEKITSPEHSPVSYRDYIDNTYSLKNMMARINKEVLCVE